ncbi:uncharacterized protein STEHIDRAFT_57501 [Stereum hirsutum FP-91666 SS1]|uniref:uncharacterized protein n=1 Tax=Stereum hirsutum (strain FP-91666) TaxID=721885 RepID=UPI000440D32A|nr:uncharacterized protein STEHIDRAFT_57501 [Stereum hirsutum FP-91666 SS1]EIM86900.1 hypothetical protein STEHIDRAFT_57501 [Stereum hirsutum FP-91666 SS1]
MEDDVASYPKHPRSTVHRYKNRAAYDYETIHRIVNTSPILHVSFPTGGDEDEDPFPAILPMIGFMASFSSPDSTALDEPLDLYLHGYTSSRLMRLGSKSSSPSSDDDIDNNSIEETEHGLPVSIAASQLHGLVLSLTPNSHSYNYTSSILHGYCTPITSPSEKLWALERLTNHIMPHRWADTRVPPDETEMRGTRVLKVRVVSASAKMRRGEPHDMKKDEGDEGLKGRVWTGVVPVYTVMGEPVRFGGGGKGKGKGKGVGGLEVPGYVREYVRGENERTEREAMEAMREP